MLYLAAHPPENGGFSSIRETAASLGISQTFLAKIVLQLVKDGLLEAVRGAGGGIRLNKAPEDISILEVIQSLEGPDFLTSCLLGLNTCDDNHPCPLHRDWLKLKPKILGILEKNHLNTFSEKILLDMLRLSDP